jgi:hypothetical protein
MSNHRWDYGGSNIWAATSRTCKTCGMEARMWRPGGRSDAKAWEFKRPKTNTAWFRNARWPRCPGTPWRRIGDRWELTGKRDIGGVLAISGVAVTDAAIRRSGRQHIESLLRCLPELPASAWEVLR